MILSFPHPKLHSFSKSKSSSTPKTETQVLKHFKTAYNIVKEEMECVYFLVREIIEVSGAFHWTERWNNNIQRFMAVRNSMAT
jgi:hypothetical protein